MASPLSKAYARTMQVGMAALVWMDRHFGNPIVAEGGASPHATIAQLRARGDVLRSYMVNGWIVVAHADVKTLLQDKRLSSEVFRSKLIERVIRSAAPDATVPLIDYPSLVNIDAPDHTRLRRLSARSFTNRFVQSLEPNIRRIVTELLDQVAKEPEFDVMEALARPLPAIVIAEMLGVPTEERHLFEEWSAELVRYTEFLNPDAIAEAAHGDRSMRDYLEKLVARKRREPADDLVSRLIAAEEDGDALDVEELLSLCTLLLVAGHETTTRLIGSCLHLLLQHPEQLAAARANRDLVAPALEEALRLEPPVLAVSRIVAEPFEFRGARFRRGQVLLLSIAGANRDPAVFDDPDRFDVHREKLDHVSFGHGVHLCLGMPLARLEAAIAFEVLLDRYEELSFATETHDWGESPFFRGPTELRVHAKHRAMADEAVRAGVGT